MASCAAKASTGKPMTKEQAAGKLAKGLKSVFLSVNEVKELHLKMRGAPAASTERSEFQKAKKQTEDKCKDVLGRVVKLIVDFKPSKEMSPMAQKFHKEVVEQKDNYGKLKTYFNKTITPMLDEYEKSMEDYVKEGNRRLKCDYASLAKELGVHLAKAYSTIYVEHSRFGKYFFEPAKGKK